MAAVEGAQLVEYLTTSNQPCASVPPLLCHTCCSSPAWLSIKQPTNPRSVSSQLCRHYWSEELPWRPTCKMLPFLAEGESRQSGLFTGQLSGDMMGFVAVLARNESSVGKLVLSQATQCIPFTEEWGSIEVFQLQLCYFTAFHQDRADIWFLKKIQKTHQATCKSSLLSERGGKSGFRGKQSFLAGMLMYNLMVFWLQNLKTKVHQSEQKGLSAPAFVAPGDNDLILQNSFSSRDITCTVKLLSGHKV